MKISDFISNEPLEHLAKFAIDNNLDISPVTRNKFLKLVTDKNFISDFLSEKEIEQIILLYFGEKILIKSKYYPILREIDNGIEFFEESKQFIKEFFKNNIYGEFKEQPKIEFIYNNLMDKFITFIKSKNYKYTLHRIPNMLLAEAKTTLNLDEDQIKFLYFFLLDNKFIIIDDYSNLDIDTELFKRNFLEINDEEKFQILFSYFIDRYLFKIIKGKNVITRIVQYIFRKIKSIDINKSTQFINNYFGFDEFKSIIDLSIKLHFFSESNGVISKIFNFNNPKDDLDTFLYVQPNYEIITSFLTDLDKRLFISEFATLEKHDTAIIYSITKESIISAMANKINVDDIIEFLNNESMNPVPQNVIYSIKQWSEEFGVALLKKTEILKCKDSFWAEKILSLPDVNKYIVERLSDTIFEINDMIEFSQFLSENKIYSEIYGTQNSDEDNIDNENESEESSIDVELLPSYLKKFYRSERMIALETDDLLKVVKYAFTKDIRIEFLYQDKVDKTLNNKKLSGEIIEIDDGWDTLEMVVYIEQLKHDYIVKLNNIVRLRPILE